MSRRAMLLTLGAAVAVSASAALARQPAPPRAAAAAHGSPPGEVERIQAHLAEVERELLARDVSHLGPSQRAARAARIAELRAYRERGVFPHNHDFAGERVPYFVDEHGTLCAMAHLIAQSGGAGLVARVAATANNARVPELAGDSALVAWLDANGMTLAEAARVQPSYDDGSCVFQPCVDEPQTAGAATGKLTGGIVSSGVAIGALAWTLHADSRSRRATGPALVGLAAGAAALWLGASQFDDSGAPLAIGVTNAAIGAATTAVSLRSLLRDDPRPVEPEDAAPVAASERRSALSLAPLVDARNGAMGVRVGLTF